jgi:hypothetical protein
MQARGGETVAGSGRVHDLRREAGRGDTRLGDFDLSAVRAAPEL